ncbi:MAG TPA: ABC transporter permease [Acidimicrobiia bacterium]|jgi:lipooligosaccharide transport system permease protein
MVAPVKGSLLVLERHARVYKHTWRASIISTFLNPILLLLAMGVGLGSLVDERGGPGGLPYLTWLAPGLLAAAAMQTAAGDSAYPMMAAIKWIKSYDAALASPIQVHHLVGGHMGWVLIRLGTVSVVFGGVMTAFGATTPVEAFLAIGPAVLTGFAFAGPVTAYTANLQKETGLASLFRFGIVPLFLFSGTFFPIGQLPDWMEPLAFLTPLWHGVELTRWAALGLEPTVSPLIHIAVLLAFGSVFTVVATRVLKRRLIS